MSNVKQFKRDKGFESISRDMLQDTENLSLEAMGLLAHLQSWDDSKWKLYKTELYTRFAKSKRRKVQSAWDELVEEKYLVQFIKRTGKTYDYIYYYSHLKFTDEEILQIATLEKAELWDGKRPTKNAASEDIKSTEASNPPVEYPEDPEKNWDVQNAHPKKMEEFSDVQNEQPKMGSPKRTGKKLSIQEVNHKEINHLKEKEDEEEYIYKLRSENITYDIIFEFLKNEGLSNLTIKQTLKKCFEYGIDICRVEDIQSQYVHMTKKNLTDDPVADFPKYFADGLLKRIEKFMMTKKYTDNIIAEQTAWEQNRTIVPFYNWLEERN